MATCNLTVNPTSGASISFFVIKLGLFYFIVLLTVMLESSRYPEATKDAYAYHKKNIRLK